MATLGYPVPKDKRTNGIGGGGGRRHLELEGELNFGDALKMMKKKYNSDIKADLAKQAAGEKEKSDSKVAGWFKNQNSVPHNDGTVVTNVPLVHVPVSRNSGEFFELGQLMGLKTLKNAQSPKKREDEKPGSGEMPYNRSESGRRREWQDQKGTVRPGVFDMTSSEVKKTQNRTHTPFVHQQQHRHSLHHNGLLLPGEDCLGVREYNEIHERFKEKRNGKQYSQKKWMKFFNAREANARHGDGKKAHERVCTLKDSSTKRTEIWCCCFSGVGRSSTGGSSRALWTLWLTNTGADEKPPKQTKIPETFHYIDDLEARRVYVNTKWVGMRVPVHGPDLRSGCGLGWGWVKIIMIWLPPHNRPCGRAADWAVG
eukprot:3937349-Rhodomonas_salina.1